MFKTINPEVTETKTVVVSPETVTVTFTKEEWDKLKYLTKSPYSAGELIRNNRRMYGFKDPDDFDFGFANSLYLLTHR